MPQPPIPRLAGALLAAALALPAAATAQERFFPATEDVEIMLRYLVEDGETPGIVLGFIEADGSTRVIHYGTAGPDTRPLGPKSVFEIGSITKTFTAALLADRVARGEIALDDPVQKYLPAGVTMPKWQDREITLMDLSTHHSGLPRLPDNFTPSDPTNPYADYTVEHLYAFLSGHELRREPGSQYEYSNLAVGLLGHILELHSGMKYEDLVRERLLEPLGMDQTGMGLEGELGAWMTKGHNANGEVVPYWDVIALAGAGGLRSNVEDMLTYLAAQIGPPESDIERAMQMTHEPRVQLGSGGGGLGWGIGRVGERRLLTHGGGTAGYNTSVGFDPDRRVGFVLLTNTGSFGDDIASDFLRRGPPLDLGDVAVPESVLQSYAGQYEVAPGQGMSVRLEEEGWLTLQAPGNVRFRLYAENDSSFYTRRTPWRFTFRRYGDRVTGLVADLEGTARNATRVGDETPEPRVVAGNVVAEVLDLPLTAEEMARYEGTYALALGERTLNVRVFVADGQLRVQPEGQGISRLMYQGDDAFIVAADRGIRIVFTLVNGRAETLTLHQSGQTVSGPRQP